MDSERIGPPFLTYWFQGFELKFFRDYLVISDPVNHVAYKMKMSLNKEFPFDIALIK
jgi:hypothetical protein